MLQVEGKWKWIVQRSMANEGIKVKLLAHNFLLPDSVLERADHTQALLAGCNIHFLRGDFSGVKGALAKHQEDRERPSGGLARGTFTYVRVTGEGGETMDCAKFFLETNEQGEVMSAWAG